MENLEDTMQEDERLVFEDDFAPNEYQFSVDFLDGEDRFLERQVFVIRAESVESAREILEEDINAMSEELPSNNWEDELIDVH